MSLEWKTVVFHLWKNPGPIVPFEASFPLTPTLLSPSILLNLLSLEELSNFLLRVKKLRFNVVRCRKKSVRHARKGYLVDALPKKVECQSENSGFCSFSQCMHDILPVTRGHLVRKEFCQSQDGQNDRFLAAFKS